MRATVNVSTNTSSIDHLPMISTMRYRRVRSRLLLTEPRCTVINRYASATSFPSGIITLATSTISASGHEPDVYRKITPLIMVSDSDDTAVLVFSTGRMLAGMYRIAAAMTSAQVYWIE